mgnify:CR=1 FL=1
MSAVWIFWTVLAIVGIALVVGGVIIGIGGGLTTNAFVFTSLLTIPAFSNIPLYAIAIAAAVIRAAMPAKMNRLRMIRANTMPNSSTRAWISNSSLVRSQSGASTRKDSRPMWPAATPTWWRTTIASSPPA